MMATEAVPTGHCTTGIHCFIAVALQSPLPGLQDNEPSDFEASTAEMSGYTLEITRFTLDFNSSLYAQLCGASDGRCVFASEVVQQTLLTLTCRTSSTI